MVPHISTGGASRAAPSGWRLLYQKAGEWKPVEAGGAYVVERYRYNMVMFRPVTTTALRLQTVGAAKRVDRYPGWKVR